MSGKRIGLLGGTFNPVHNGHLILAETAREEFQLDSVFFIPNDFPPHRESPKGMPEGEKRYRMCLLATVSNPFFHVLRNELDRGGISYTFDTVVELKKENPDNHYFFICGSDSILRHEWHRFKDLLGMLDGFLLAPRDGAGIEKVLAKVKKEIPNAVGKFREIRMGNMEISSTGIREQIQKRKSIRYLVPESVEHFIERYGLYRES